MLFGLPIQPDLHGSLITYFDFFLFFDFVDFPLALPSLASSRKQSSRG